jgi:hypothetical protein
MIHALDVTASRRSVFGLAAAGGAGLVLGTPRRPDADGLGAAEPVPEDHYDVTAVRPEDLQPPPPFTRAACGSTVRAQGEIGSQPTYYEVTAARASFSFNATFYGRLEAWLSFFFANTPASWARPAQVWSYGAYVNRNDGCVSYHNFGRAFDLSRIYATNPANRTMNKVFNARYDQWRSLTGAALTTTRRQYWATAASLHYHFKHVLTYLYNTAHHNHVHADNAVSGSGGSTFSTGASAQVQHVQACANYIWGQRIAIDGRWGPQTSGAVGTILRRIGATGSLTNQATWQVFNRATLRFGSGAQRY